MVRYTSHSLLHRYLLFIIGGYNLQYRWLYSWISTLGWLEFDVFECALTCLAVLIRVLFCSFWYNWNNSWFFIFNIFLIWAEHSLMLMVCVTMNRIDGYPTLLFYIEHRSTGIYLNHVPTFYLANISGWGEILIENSLP